MAKPRKVVDKWKMKSWYTVVAPEMFERKEVGEIAATDEKTLINRVVKVGLQTLTGDLTHAYTNLKLRVNEVKGRTAFTKLIGHYLSPSYLRSLVRRRRDVVDQVTDIITKDGIPVRVKVSVYTQKRIASPAKTAIRKVTDKVVRDKGRSMLFSQFEQEVIFGKFSARIYKEVKKIVPIKRVEVRKTEVREEFKGKAA